ncbi:hypothetical protein KP509_13G019700 [Ceratopteris richardii]|uniref:Uncharacterized protein n=1 Tax=Ceratopteris richardii TaxID=49495 RepID=A0A8T2TG25_CERRI|nr:hypothetical protein KP509_13G019700 [Ceratopteris richardii]
MAHRRGCSEPPVGLLDLEMKRAAMETTHSTAETPARSSRRIFDTQSLQSLDSLLSPSHLSSPSSPSYLPYIGKPFTSTIRRSSCPNLSSTASGKQKSRFYVTDLITEGRSPQSEASRSPSCISGEEPLPAPCTASPPTRKKLDGTESVFSSVASRRSTTLPQKSSAFASSKWTVRNGFSLPTSSSPSAHSSSPSPLSMSPSPSPSSSLVSSASSCSSSSSKSLPLSGETRIPEFMTASECSSKSSSDSLSSLLQSPVPCPVKRPISLPSSSSANRESPLLTKDTTPRITTPATSSRNSRPSLPAPREKTIPSPKLHRENRILHRATYSDSDLSTSSNGSNTLITCNPLPDPTTMTSQSSSPCSRSEFMARLQDLSLSCAIENNAIFNLINLAIENANPEEISKIHEQRRLFCQVIELQAQVASVGEELRLARQRNGRLEQELARYLVKQSKGR